MTTEYSLFETNEQELSNFLLCNFNQHMGTVDKALKEFIAENSKEAIIHATGYIEEFLGSHKTDVEKTEFIKNNCEIWFEGIKKKPVEWLEDVLEKLNEVSKTKQ